MSSARETGGTAANGAGAPVAPEAGAPPAPVTEWLEAMAACVRARDYERARRLFSPDVFSFGTRVRQADGIDALERGQWRHIWPATSGFRFARERARVIRVPGAFCVAVPWASTGSDSRTGPIERCGRATLTLAASHDGLVCVHSHFSLDPEPDP